MQIFGKRRDLQINDPLHGLIRLTSVEQKVVDHPLFQRLRHIVQNDVLLLVFPGATHNRFIHSIGAMNVAHQIFQNIVENTSNPEYLEVKPVNEAVDYIYSCLRLAVLLHDGHLPFSHQAERADGVRSILDDSETFEKLWAGVDVSDIYPERPKALHHEHFSVRAAHKILTDEGLDSSEIRDVLSIMDTVTCDNSHRFVRSVEIVWPMFAGTYGSALSSKEKASHVTNILKRILSSEFDADRADYLLRDSASCGTTLGKFDLEILIKNVCVAWSEEHEKLCLCIKEKGLSSFEDFIMARHKMHKNIYGHSRSRAFELQVQKAITEVLEIESFKKDFFEMITDIEQFSYLTDEFFWEAFRAVAKKDKDSYCYMLLHRKKLHFLATIIEEDDDSAHELRASLANQLNEDVEDILPYRNVIKVTKLKEGVDVFDTMIMRKSLYGEGFTLHPVYEVSDYISSTENEVIWHYYKRH